MRQNLCRQCNADVARNQANPYGGPADVLPTVWLSCAAAIDGCITASLLYILLREGSITKHARRLTSRVIALTLETGARSQIAP